MTDDQKDIFADSCKAWTSGTGITCVESDDAAIRLTVKTHTGEGCGERENVSCASVGMVQDPVMEIFMSHWEYPWIVKHEIGHALGLIHEHQRTDRGQYVFFNRNNIKANSIAAFEPVRGAITLTEYDYNSIMHYDQCTFSRHDECRPDDLSKSDYWVLDPKPCAMTSLGGDEITALDLDGIRKMYAEPVFTLFSLERRNECGTHVYSQPQLEELFGKDFSDAGPLVWSRRQAFSDYGCGWIVARDPTTFCSAETQGGREFITESLSRTRFSRRCSLGTRVNRTTECGCSQRTLNALCAIPTSAQIEEDALDRLLGSVDHHERQMGRFVQTMRGHIESGYLSFEMKESFLPIVIALFVQSETEDIASILCRVKISLTLGRIRDRDFVLELSDFRTIVERSGISI